MACTACGIDLGLSFLPKDTSTWNNGAGDRTYDRPIQGQPCSTLSHTDIAATQFTRRLRQIRWSQIIIILKYIYITTLSLFADDITLYLFHPKMSRANCYTWYLLHRSIRGEGSSSVALLKISSLFFPVKGFFYVICDIGLYKINWI